MPCVPRSTKPSDPGMRWTHPQTPLLVTGLPKLTGRRTSPFERRPNGHADRFATGFSDGNANACRSASTRSGTSR